MGNLQREKACKGIQYIHHILWNADWLPDHLSDHLQAIGISIILQQQSMEKNYILKQQVALEDFMEQFWFLTCSLRRHAEPDVAQSWILLNFLLLRDLLDYSWFHVIPLRQSPGFSLETSHLTQRSSFLKNMANTISSLLDLWVKAPNRKVEFLFTVEKQKPLGCSRSWQTCYATSCWLSI